MRDSEVWRELRALRADVPAPAKGNAERRSVFTASLEQAEQYFSAAESMGYETRAVAIFYGLSQFGRAISAAIDHDSPDEAHDWKLSGHGIRVLSISQVAARGNLADLTLRDQGKGSYTQLSGVLKSPSLAIATSLASIWDSIPEVRDHPLRRGIRYPALDLDEGHDQTIDPEAMWGRRIIELRGVPVEISDIMEFLSHYPAIPTLPKKKHYEAPSFGRRGEIYISPIPEYKVGGFSTLHGSKYRDRNIVFPALLGNAKPQHPILAWWAVLYALSMLARYEPAGWAKMIEVDSSHEAVPIECLLDSAIYAVPSIVASILKNSLIPGYARKEADENLASTFKRPEIRTIGEVTHSSYRKIDSWRRARFSRGPSVDGHDSP